MNKLKRILSLFVAVTIALSVVIVPVTTMAAEEMVEVFTVHNAEFEIKSSTGMGPQIWSSLWREGDSVFDWNFMTSAGTELYDGVKIYDINGNEGDDYIILMTVSTNAPVPMQKLKVWWEQGTPYQWGPLAYLDEPTRCWPEGFDIYVSDTGEEGSWENVYHADTLEGQLKMEQIIPDVWDDSEGWRPYYEIDLGKVVTAKYLRFTIEEMQPYLGDIMIYEFETYAPVSSIPSNYHKINVDTTDRAEVEIISPVSIGDEYCPEGDTVTLKVTPDAVSQIDGVKVDGKPVEMEIAEDTGVVTCVFTMPNADVDVKIDSNIHQNEDVALEMVSAKILGEENGIIPAGTVPVVEFQLNRGVEFVDKYDVLVNGKENTGLIQHAFVDAMDNTKLYAVPFSDKLDKATTYTITFKDDIKSAAGKSLSGKIEASFTTADDYGRDIHLDKSAYITGYGDGNFGPEDNVTVEQALIIANRLAGDKDFSGITSVARPITRLELAEILYIMKNGAKSGSQDDMFNALVEDGIIKGYDDGTFRRDTNLTRAEAVTLFNRVIDRDTLDITGNPIGENIFADVAEDHWAVNEIIAAITDVGSTSLPWTENIPEIDTLDQFNKDNDIWTQVPAVSQELRDKGIQGGEGGQWMQAIECDTVDGQLLFAGVDIAGLLRSTDGGETWHRSFRGFNAKGCVDIEIDPNNKERVIAIGSLSKEPFTGIYMSDDMGTNWSHKYMFWFGGQRDTRKQLAWDKSSYDEEIGGSKIAYWSTMWKTYAGLELSDQEYDDDRRTHNGYGLVKTTDGGKTWSVVNSDMTDSVVEVHPETGVVYCSNERGFFRSEDGGVTFDWILKGTPIYGLDVINTYPDHVYLNDKDGILISTDSGKTFTRVETSTFPERPVDDVRNMVRDLAVSPANPNHMLVDSRNYREYKNKRFYSKDGGKTWAESGYDGSLDFFFNHSRQHPYAWHPTDENKVWSLGGDWVTSSSDGGETFIWDANGICGTPPGGRINFNPFNTDLIFAGAQDLTGLLSKDGGYTWVPIEPTTGGGFGCAYGNYAADENLLIFAIADGWYSGRTLYVSRDGGDTFESTGLPLKNGGARRATSFWGSVTDRDTFFAGEYVTHDRAETWTEMKNCIFVMALNYYHNREIYGLNNKECVVVSYDNGDTWLNFSRTYIETEEVYRGGGSIYSSGAGAHCWDIEYDGINDIMYYCSGSAMSAHGLVKVIDNVHKNIGGNIQIQDKVGDKWIQLIALDPRHPEIVYIGGYGAGSQQTTNIVQRSCDYGESFQIISSMGDSKSIVPDGPSTGAGAETLVVHPETGELWMWANAEGLWTFPAPYTEK